MGKFRGKGDGGRHASKGRRQTRIRTSLGIASSYRGYLERFPPSTTTYEASLTKPFPWLVRAHRRRRNEIARASRKANR